MNKHIFPHAVRERSKARSPSPNPSPCNRNQRSAAIHTGRFALRRAAAARSRVVQEAA